MMIFDMSEGRANPAPSAVGSAEWQERQYALYYGPRAGGYLPDIYRPNDGYGQEAGYDLETPYSASPILHLDALADGLEPPPEGDPLDHFFTGKRVFAASRIENILGLIYEREQLRENNLLRIDENACSVQDRLFPFEYWSPGINAEVDKVRTNLEREIIGLDREKRMEEVACWRDVARLRAELDEAAREFGRERAKESLLSYPATPYTPQP